MTYSQSPRASVPVLVRVETMPTRKRLSVRLCSGWGLRYVDFACEVGKRAFKFSGYSRK